MVKEDEAGAMRALMDLLATRDLIGNSLSMNELLTATLTAISGGHLTIQAVTGKDIIMALTDAAGARSFLIKDSGAATIFSVDSDGNIIATKLTGSLVGDVTSGDDAAHDYGAAHADWTLSATEKKAPLLVVSNADAGANIIGPAENRQYVLRNASGQTVTIKKSAGTGVAVANGKTAVVRYSSSVADYVRVTADATH